MRIGGCGGLVFGEDAKKLLKQLRRGPVGAVLLGRMIRDPLIEHVEQDEFVRSRVAILVPSAQNLLE